MTHIDLDELRVWAQEAGAIAKERARDRTVRRKPDKSIVTDVDEIVERFLVERISARYPDHGVIGEEQARQDINREFLWALDPIDGTSAFVYDLPLWGVSIGVLRNGQPHAGVIYLPMIDDYYWAGPDGPALMNGDPITVAPAHERDSEDWLASPADVHLLFDITFPGKLRTLGSTIASFAYVARGHAIGALMDKISLWDIAAGMAILQAAGGVAVGLDGQPFDISTMLSGDLSRAPLLIGSPHHIDALREGIRQRRNEG